MKNYTDRETAPLKFHYFYLILLVLFAIPALLDAVLIVMALFIVGVSELSGWTLLGLLFYFVYLFLFLKVLGGLWFWKKSGLKALYILVALNIADALLSFEATPEGILSLLISVLISGLIVRYYHNRKMLFTESGAAPKEDPASAYTFDPVEEPAPAEPQPALAEEPAPEAEPAPAEEPAPEAEPAPQMRFCRHCGARLAEGARFCAACGKPVEE